MHGRRKSIPSEKYVLFRVLASFHCCIHSSWRFTSTSVFIFSSNYTTCESHFAVNFQKRERGRMRVHHLNNVNKALQILEQNNVSRWLLRLYKKETVSDRISWFSVVSFQVKLVNISSNDIVDGNPKLTLGLVWSIILHWQVSFMTGSFPCG